MKGIILFLILVLSSLVFAQDPNFPLGFNPDGEIGGFVITFLAGYVKNSYDFENPSFSLNASLIGYHLTGGLDLPIDRHATLLGRMSYVTASKNESQQSFKKNDLIVSFGIRIFGEKIGK